MTAQRGTPTLGPRLHRDWARHYFRHLPGRPDLVEALDGPGVFLGTGLEYLLDSAGGPDAAVLACRNPHAGAGRRRFLLWHGRHRLHEEAFQGWFGHRLQPVRTDSFKLLLERLDHFLIADATTRPTFVIPLRQFVATGVSHGVLESVLDAPVVVATDALYARAAYVASQRVYVAYEGARYADSTRKLFFDPHGNPVPVESVARDVLRRQGLDVVSPALFARLFFALIGRPASHFESDVWPSAFLTGRLSPLEWVLRARERLAIARKDGVAGTLESALETLGRRPPFSRHPPPDGALPLIARYITRRRFEALCEALGDPALLALFEALLRGHRVHSADWFAWGEGHRASFWEVKSRGDVLRDTQKGAILWCQRSGALDFRLLEILHNPPSQTLMSPPGVAAVEPHARTPRAPRTPKHRP